MAPPKKILVVEDEQQEQWQRFMADASVRLAASLEVEDALRTVCDLLVPRRADWCLVHLLRTNTTMPATTMTGPPCALRPSQELGVVLKKAVERGEPELAAPIPGEEWIVRALGRDHEAALRDVLVRSFLCVPLRARDRILGALVLVSKRNDRVFGPHDLAFATDLANRLAMALEGALLLRQTKHAMELREAVLAVVSHDLRNLLTSILTRAQLWAAGRPAPGTPESIVRTAKKMARLIGDLLDATSIDAGRLSVSPSIHSAAELARDALDSIRPDADQKALALATDLPSPSVSVMADGVRLHEVLTNLLTNALKYAQPGGRIHVRARQTGTLVRFEVEDDGPGIRSDHLPHVFERMWHAPKSMVGREGSGLGLYIARGIVEAHGGQIWVENNLGAGCTFFFTLPTARADSELRAPSP